MVCKRQWSRGVLKIHLREICLGFSKNVVLWCDDEITTSSILLRHSDYLAYQQFRDQECMQTQYLYKTHSILTRAYLDSIFFKISLQIAENIVFVQNITRKNENMIKVVKSSS